jgi:hypothetical protein
MDQNRVRDRSHLENEGMERTFEDFKGTGIGRAESGLVGGRTNKNHGSRKEISGKLRWRNGM